MFNHVLISFQNTFLYLLRLHFQHMQHVAARQAGRNGSGGANRAEGWSGVCKDARKARYSHALAMCNSISRYFKLFYTCLTLFDFVPKSWVLEYLRMSHRQGWRYPASDLAKPRHICRERVFVVAVSQHLQRWGLVCHCELDIWTSTRSRGQ